MENPEALLLIDIQNDFLPGGALAVPHADGIFPLANQIQAYFTQIIATKDWHPANHISFISNHPTHQVFDTLYLSGIPQVLWPIHCVQETKGAEFPPQLQLDKISKIIYKGTDPNLDSYSGFFDNAHRKATGLEDYLRAQNIHTLYIMGLATDYCVLYSVQDAIKLGFRTIVIEDGCFGINQNPDAAKNAFKTMQECGALILPSQSIMNKQLKRPR